MRARTSAEARAQALLHQLRAQERCSRDEGAGRSGRSAWQARLQGMTGVAAGQRGEARKLGGGTWCTWQPWPSSNPFLLAAEGLQDYLRFMEGVHTRGHACRLPWQLGSAPVPTSG